jgi:plastocyanin
VAVFRRLLVILILSLTLPAVFAQKAPGPVTWVVTVGTEAVNGTWQYNRFYPADLTVRQGDQVTFRFVTGDMHNVVFPVAGQPAVSGRIPDPNNPKNMIPNPAINASALRVYDGTSPVSSGIVHGSAASPSDYTLTVTATGDLVYTCTVHAQVHPDGTATGMVGYLHVQPAGSDLVQTPEAVAAAAQKQIAADVASAEAADAAAHVITSRPDGQGHQIWTVGVGATSATGGEFLGFGAEDLHIHVGDTVEWIQRAETSPHTVTFADKSMKGMDMGGGPGAFAPSGGPTYDGTGFVNSGFMPGTKTGRVAKPFLLTFTKAGEYSYYCIPHAMMGMAAIVTVE